MGQVRDELANIASSLYGQKLSDTEEKMLRDKLPGKLVPPWLLEMLKEFPLAGVSFSMPKEEDESHMGVDLKWMIPSHVIDEALSTYPGLSVLSQGYLPIGSCLEGSGDPYFLDLREGSDDPAIVRIPHDSVPSDSQPYPEDDIELVCSTMSEFFSIASID